MSPKQNQPTVLRWKQPTGESAARSQTASSTQNRFSPEQLAKFEERYENDYDIYTDHDYVAWLQEFHAESLPPIEVMLGLGTDSPSDEEFPERRTLSAPRSSLSNSSPSAPDCSSNGSPPGSPYSSSSPTAPGST